MGKLTIFSLLLLLHIPRQTRAEGSTEGQSFIVAFAQSREGTPFYGRLHILNSGSDDAQVNISSLPTAPDVIDISFTVPSGQDYVYAVDENFEMPAGNLVADFGIKILTSTPVIIDVNDTSVSNGDAFPLLPTSLLGKEYFAAGFKQTSTIAASYILIVAQFDNTRVTIPMHKLQQGETITLNDVTYGQNDVVDISLNALQALQIQTNSDLTGTKILSSSLVAAFSGVNRTKINAPGATSDCYSHMSDQLPPLSHWGSRFVLLSSPNQTAGDIYRFVSGWAGTEVTLHTEVAQTTHFENSGDFFEYDLPPETFVYVESDKPVMVYQVIMSLEGTQPGGDPSLSVHAPLEHVESRYTFVSDAADGYTEYIAVIANSTETDGIELNGISLSNYNAEWWPVPETNLTAGFVAIEGFASPQMMTLSHVTGHVFGAHVYKRAYCEASSMPLTYGKPLETYQYMSRIAETAEGKRSDIFSITQFDARRSADKANIIKVRGLLTCAQACVEDVNCWGFNFNPSLSNTCELLLDHGGAMVNSPGWSYAERCHE